MGLLSRLFGQRASAETAAERADWIVGATRQACAAAHRAQLDQIATARRGFESAETPAFVASWATSANEINDDLASQLQPMRNRSRQLARNNEWATRYLIQLDDNVLSSAGIRLQMRLRDRSGKALDSEANASIEKAWAEWGARGVCEVSGKHTWREVESLAVGSLARNGELLYRLRPGAGPWRFQIQLLNPALLDTHLKRDYNGRRVRLGVEIDDDGRPVAYWLRMARTGDSAPDVLTVGQHVRVPAEQICHRFLAEEIDQLRGMPWLSVGARRLWMAHQFEEAAAVASINSAQRLGFFVSPSGEAPDGFADKVQSAVDEAATQAGRALTYEEKRAVRETAEQYVTTAPGQFDTLPVGFDFRQYESPWPNVDAGQYVKDQIRGWSGARGASYVTVGNDLEAVNYSSARVGILDEREHYKVLQSRFISWLHADVFAAWLPYAVARTPGLSAQRIGDYLAAATWRPRRWEGIDPAKEAKANESDLDLGLTSRSRIILERGDDPEEIAAERTADEALFGPLPAARPSAPTPADTEDDDPSPSRPAAKAAGNFLPSFIRPVARK